MPSTSPAQAKLMAISAHTLGGYGGVPQSVGKEFHQADAGKKYGAEKPSESKIRVAKALMGNRNG